MPAYGVFSNAGQGHVVTSILIAMVAMVFTAMSYGRMARVYPSAGSAYTYVGRTLHPSLGYVTGWSMTMDYMLNPLICTIWCSKAMADLLSGTRYQIPYPGLLWPIIFAVLFTGAEFAGSQDLGADQSDLVRHHGSGDSGVFLVHHPLHFPFAAISGGLFPASVLQPGNFYYQPGVSRHFGRGAHLHRVRRHFDLVGRGGQSQAKYFPGDGAGLRDHGISGCG